MISHVPDFFARYRSRYTEEPNSGCWLWHGSQTRSGYGNFTFRRSSGYAHRASYEAANGEGSARGLVVRHRCDNPSCINPDHLLIGTTADNVADAWLRDRMKPVRGEKSGRAILTEAVVLKARAMARSGAAICDIARSFGAPRSSIEYAVTGASWAHLPGAVPLDQIKKAPARTTPRRGSDALTAKLTEACVREIKRRLRNGETGRAIAAQFSISPAAVSSINVGRNWSHVDR